MHEATPYLKTEKNVKYLVKIKGDVGSSRADKILMTVKIRFSF